jgi:hypothetical protein
MQTSPARFKNSALRALDTRRKLSRVHSGDTASRRRQGVDVQSEASKSRSNGPLLDISVLFSGHFLAFLSKRIDLAFF